MRSLVSRRLAERVTEQQNDNADVFFIFGLPPSPRASVSRRIFNYSASIVVSLSTS